MCFLGKQMSIVTSGQADLVILPHLSSQKLLLPQIYERVAPGAMSISKYKQHSIEMAILLIFSAQEITKFEPVLEWLHSASS